MCKSKSLLLLIFSVNIIGYQTVNAAPIVVTPGGNAGYMYFPAPQQGGGSSTINGDTSPPAFKDETIWWNTTVTPPANTRKIYFTLVGGGALMGQSGYITTGCIIYQGGNLVITIGEGGRYNMWGANSPAGNTTLTYTATGETFVARGGSETGERFTGGYMGGPGIYRNSSGTLSMGKTIGYNGQGYSISQEKLEEASTYGYMKSTQYIVATNNHPILFPSYNLDSTKAGSEKSAWGWGASGGVLNSAYVNGNQGVVMLRYYR